MILDLRFEKKEKKKKKLNRTIKFYTIQSVGCFYRKNHLLFTHSERINSNFFVFDEETNEIKRTL